VEALVGEPLARDLIHEHLIRGLLRPELEGRYDVIRYIAVELNTVKTVRVAP
jgi:hypothetical protein